MQKADRVVKNTMTEEETHTKILNWQSTNKSE